MLLTVAVLSLIVIAQQIEMTVLIRRVKTLEERTSLSRILPIHIHHDD